MKILFINLPYYGHVIPTIGLVKELIKHGCDVTYMLPFDWEEKVTESGAVFYGYENHKQLAEQMKKEFPEEQFKFLGPSVYERKGMYLFIHQCHSLMC